MKRKDALHSINSLYNKRQNIFKEEMDAIKSILLDIRSQDKKGEIESNLENLQYLNEVQDKIYQLMKHESLNTIHALYYEKDQDIKAVAKDRNNLSVKFFADLFQDLTLAEEYILFYNDIMECPKDGKYEISYITTRIVEDICNRLTFNIYDKVCNSKNEELSKARTPQGFLSDALFEIVLYHKESESLLAEKIKTLMESSNSSVLKELLVETRRKNFLENC